MTIDTLSIGYIIQLITIGLILIVIKSLSAIRSDISSQKMWAEQHEKRDEDRFAVQAQWLQEVYQNIKGR